jgi:hypothetical protein
MASAPPDEQLTTKETDAEVHAYYERLRADGEILLGGSGFRIEINSSIGAVMAFDHKRKVVLVNPERIEAQGFTDDQKRYVFSHEIAHFVQLASDPDSYIRTFTLAEEKAKAHGKVSGKASEEEKKIASANQQQIQRLWNRFYNVFLDISDNAIVDRRSMWTQRMGKETHPRETLYQKLTPGNLQGSPRTEQFLFSILRRAMLGSDAPVSIDADMQADLEKPYVYLGKTYPSVFEFVRRKFFDADQSMDVFLSALERSLAPLFERYLQEDIDSQKIHEAQRPVDMDGQDMEPGAGKKMAEDVKKGKASASEKAASKEAEEFSERMKGKGFSEAEVRRMLEIRERANEVFESLVELWGVFLQTAYTTDVVESTGHRAGVMPDVAQFVRQFPDYETQPDKLKIFIRRLLTPEVESVKPKLIELHLVLDLSGSMDPQKRKETQETVYALAKSLIQFRRDRMAVADEQAGPTDINIRLIGFGSTHQDLLDRSAAEIQEGRLNDDNPNLLDERLWRSILRIGSVDLGGTRDAEALQDILNDVSRPDRVDMFTQGDRVAVTMEVTDGETETVSESASIVGQLNKQTGVYARGIQIPGLLHADAPEDPRDEKGRAHIPELIEPTGSFEHVWGKNGLRLDRLEQLRTVVLKLLFDALIQRQKGE